MAELMEQRAHVVGRQQRRLAGPGLGEVVVVQHHGQRHGRPAVVRTTCSVNGARAGGTVALSGTNAGIHGFALRQGYILLSGSNGTARNNLVGMTATGSSADASSSAYGITFSAPNATVRSNFVTVNNSSIRSDGGATGSVVSFNEVARPTSGHTNTFDGILLINGASGTQISANLVRDQRGGGIELGFGAATDVYSNVTVSNNTVSNNGFDSGTTPSTERLGMVSYNYTGSNVVYSRNRVINNGGPGLILLNANGTIATQNSFSGNGGLAIDLDPVTRDPNGLGVPNGVTLNDTGDTDTGPNGLLNYPVITSAVLAGGELSITGFARPGSAIELYLAAADPTGFGEGVTYLTLLTEGSGADLVTTTGSYGPAAINGLAQWQRHDEPLRVPHSSAGQHRRGLTPDRYDHAGRPDLGIQRQCRRHRRTESRPREDRRRRHGPVQQHHESEKHSGFRAELHAARDEPGHRPRRQRQPRGHRCGARRHRSAGPGPRRAGLGTGHVQQRLAEQRAQLHVHGARQHDRQSGLLE